MEKLPSEIVSNILAYLNSQELLNFLSVYPQYFDVLQEDGHTQSQSDINMNKMFQLHPMNFEHFFKTSVNLLNVKSLNINGIYWIESIFWKRCFIKMKHLTILHAMDTTITMEDSYYFKELTELAINMNQNDFRCNFEGMSNIQCLSIKLISSRKIEVSINLATDFLKKFEKLTELWVIEENLRFPYEILTLDILPALKIFVLISHWQFLTNFSFSNFGYFKLIDSTTSKKVLEKQIGPSKKYNSILNLVPYNCAEDCAGNDPQTIRSQSDIYSMSGFLPSQKNLLVICCTCESKVRTYLQNMIARYPNLENFEVAPCFYGKGCLVPNINCISRLKKLKRLSITNPDSQPKSNFFEKLFTRCMDLTSLRLICSRLCPNPLYTIRDFFLNIKHAKSLKDLQISTETLNVTQLFESLNAMEECNLERIYLECTVYDGVNSLARQIKKFLENNHQLVFVFLMLFRVQKAKILELQAVFNSFCIGKPAKIFIATNDDSEKFNIQSAHFDMTHMDREIGNDIYEIRQELKLRSLVTKKW